MERIYTAFLPMQHVANPPSLPYACCLCVAAGCCVTGWAPSAAVSGRGQGAGGSMAGLWYVWGANVPRSGFVDVCARICVFLCVITGLDDYAVMVPLCNMPAQPPPVKPCGGFICSRRWSLHQMISALVNHQPDFVRCLVPCDYATSA